MIDIRLLRTDLDATKVALARKGVDGADVDRAADLDARLRAAASDRDRVRGLVNALSKQVGQAMRSGETDTAAALRAESALLGEQEKEREPEHDAIAAELRDLLLRIPNVPAPDAPDGASADDNIELERVGFDPAAYGAHQRMPHWEIGAELGILDMERGAKISGSMFPLYRGWGATAGTSARAVRPRSQHRCLRGDPPAHARPHRHDGGHRSAAKVRRRRVLPRARRPVGHPHR